MTRIHRLTCLLVVAASLTTLPAPAASQPATPSTAAPDRHVADGVTADVILERALARSAAQDESGIELAFDYIVNSSVDTLDGDGAITNTDLATYHRYPLEGLLYEELIEVDGEPLDKDALREEEEKKADFIREAKAHAARGEVYEPSEMNIRFGHELMDRYHTTLDRTETLRGHPCWVLHFEPRDGKLPDNRRMDKALNRSTGNLWIAQDDYGVVRVSFEMQEAFRYMWGIVATLRRASGQFEFSRVDNGFWSPASLDLQLDLRVFFKGIRRHVRQDWVDVRRLDVSTADR